MCLPTGAGEDASPLGLRPVGAAEDGENPTHGGGWTLAAATRSEFLGVDEAERVNARVEGEDQRREMRRLAGERAVFIADPRGSGASRLRTQGRRSETRGGCRLGGFRARREFIPSGCRTASSAWAQCPCQRCIGAATAVRSPMYGGPRALEVAGWWGRDPPDSPMAGSVLCCRA